MKYILFKCMVKGEPQIDTYDETEDINFDSYAEDEKFEFELTDSELESRVKEAMEDGERLRSAISLGVDKNAITSMVYNMVNEKPDPADIKTIKEGVEIIIREEVIDDFLAECHSKILGSDFPDDGYCQGQHCYDSELIIEDNKLRCPRCGKTYKS